MSEGLSNKSGWLHIRKTVQNGNPWQRRFFHLDVVARVLYVFLTETDCAQYLRNNTVTWEDRVELNAAVVYTGVDYCEDPTGEVKYFIELTTPRRAYFLGSSNVVDVQEWVTVLSCSNCNVALMTPDREVYFQVYAPRTALRGRYGTLRKRGRGFNKDFKPRFFRTMENASGEWVLAYYLTPFAEFPQGEPLPLKGATFYMGDLHVNPKAPEMKFSDLDMLIQTVEPTFPSENGKSATPSANDRPVYLFSIKTQDGKRTLCLEASSAFDVREWCEALYAIANGRIRPEVIDVLARQDLYALLGISSDADTEQIASAFQAQAATLGIDVNIKASAIAAAQAAGKDYFASLGGAKPDFSSRHANAASSGDTVTTTARRLVLAYTILMQPKKRAVYDKLRNEAMAAAEARNKRLAGDAPEVVTDASIDAEARLREFERSPTVFMSNYAAEYVEAAPKVVRHRLTIAASEEAEEKMTSVSVAGSAALALQASQRAIEDSDDEFGVGRRPIQDSDEEEDEPAARNEVTASGSSERKPDPESAPKSRSSSLSSTSQPIVSAAASTIADTVAQTVPTSTRKSIAASVVAAAAATATTSPTVSDVLVSATTSTIPSKAESQEDELSDLESEPERKSIDTTPAPQTAAETRQGTSESTELDDKRQAILVSKLTPTAIKFVKTLPVNVQAAVVEFLQGVVLLKVPHGRFASPSETKFTIEYDPKHAGAPWGVYWESKKSKDEACVRIRPHHLAIEQSGEGPVFEKHAKLVAKYGKDNCIALLSTSPSSGRDSLEVIFTAPDPAVRDGFVAFVQAVLANS